ncbi:DUF1715-domain-containing protein [Auriscalpium vulgare]|uniref:DUF1715-domain-containing protein n=1 Tax=Auriscalpium vulgare TaxID=40419 RepID=A0ACB8RL06_9AGAM|nr:DUF1715-domain-containing protein [Auriscalpium vulgare]
MADFDLEDLVHVEQTFYDSGYADGHAHGRIHGLIEGRALGREKGFEIWEELGFYEGAARMWTAVYAARGRDADRAMHHARQLLAQIAQFPRTNPREEDGVDMAGMLRQIRSRYKALCASVGVRASLRAAGGDEDGVEAEVPAAAAVGGPRRPQKGVWRVDGAPAPEGGLSF